MNGAFCDRPMVKRLVEIFGDPPKPGIVVDGPRNSQAEDRHVPMDFWSWNRQFLDRLHGVDPGDRPRDFSYVAPEMHSWEWNPFQKGWHEADDNDLYAIHYHLSVEIDLAPEYFNYVYPVALIRWWERQLDRRRSDSGTYDFYTATARNDLLDEFLDSRKKQAVCDWVVDAYMEGVTYWGGELSIDDYGSPCKNLQGPLTTFNALGQSFPVTKDILDRLEKCESLGHAQWWLVFGTGIVWNADEGEFIWPDELRLNARWGVYINHSDAYLDDTGYLDANLEALASRLSVEMLITNLRKSVPMLLYTPDYLWAVETLAMIETTPDVIAKRIGKLIECLGRPGLGQSSTTPLKD